MEERSINIGLVGITGYTGMELARLLATHPRMRLTVACSRAEAGRRLGDFYPFLEKLPGADVVISEFNARTAAQDCDVVFLAVPHGKAMEMAADLLEAGTKVVDLSADFRLRDADTYEAWYVPHTRKHLLHRAVYGLPELYAAEAARASLVANPGCYPSASILGLYPALKHGLIDTDGIVIDAKSGTTGAGRKAVVTSLYCEVNDTFRAYGLGKHRHTPELEQEGSLVAGRDVTISFNPHLVPMNRGILATIYTRLLASDTTLDAVHEAYMETWGASRWVRVLPKGKLPETRHVRGSMFCDIGLVVDPRTRRLIIVSAIDNLGRGASGQALVNANLMCGLPVETGLEGAPLMP